MRLGRFLAVAAAVLLLAPAAAVAQSSIAGAVTDDTGGVLPGVTIEAASPVLIEGSRVVFTDGTGSYNIIDLRPGEYSVTFTLPGFGTLVRDQLILGADVAMPLDAVMAVGSVEETITVSGETPVVDVQQVQRIEVMTRETQEAIPTGRSMWSYALLIPGVKVHKPDVGGTAGVQQSEMMGRGLDAAHTTIEVDGMMINTMISDGRYQAYLNPMLAAETSYTTSGQGAETQNGGLRINMIPNEGGNQFSGNFFGGFTPGGWQADNLGLAGDGLSARNQVALDTGIKQPTAVEGIFDTNGAIGGPVFRDRLWFFSTGRFNGVNNAITNSINPDGTQGLDNNTIHSGNVRLTWQMTQQHKISAMFDKVRKRRFSNHGPGTDLNTAASSWTSPHYDTGTAKWTGTLSNRMLAEFGFSLIYEDWDPGYYRFRDDGNLIYQVKPDAASLATCFETPCFPAVGSQRHMDQLSHAMGGDPWYSQVPIRDGRLGLLYGAKGGGENNNYTHRWAYQSALSYVTGSHSFKFGMNISNGHNRHTSSSNGNLDLRYDDGANPRGDLIQDSPLLYGMPWFNCDHPKATANIDAGTMQGNCGLLGSPDQVRVFSHPSNLSYKLDYNGGFYAQDSWTVDRLTLNYGLRIDFAAISVPEAPKGSGRFVPAQLQPGRLQSELPSFGPDFSPRLSVAYDVFGDARTALKFGWNKYVRDIGGTLSARYAYGFSGSDGRDWFDCHMNAAGDDCTGMNPYGSNFDGVAQNWEIGARESSTFGSITTPTRTPDITAREYNRIWTVGLQQEVFPGISLSGEYRQRTYHNTWWDDNPNWSFSDFGADSMGNPMPQYAGIRHFQVARPYPLVGQFTAFSVDPAVRTNQEGFADRTRGPGYTNVYRGFELSIQGRLPGGGTLFGGWSLEDTGRTSIYGYDQNSGAGTRYGGEVNNCSDIIERGDEPHQLRYCDASQYPRPYRNEFKLSGTQPFSLPLAGDLQLGASLQAYPGGLGTWGGMQEGLSISRTSTNHKYNSYSEELFGQPGHCVAPCVLGARIVPDNFPTVERSTSGAWYPMIPLNSVKFLPYWTQLDVNIQKVFNIGNWRYDARFEFFNALNNGVVIEQTGSRNASGSTGADYQALSQWERGNRMLEGRVIRFALTARF